ncbi:MAG TPA: hypothetical protein VIT23_04760 [Terrimicrobiaceae bacterium]
MNYVTGLIMTTPSWMFLQFFSQEFDHGKTEFRGTLLVLALSARAADVRT